MKGKEDGRSKPLWSVVSGVPDGAHAWGVILPQFVLGLY